MRERHCHLRRFYALTCSAERDLKLVVVTCDMVIGGDPTFHIIQTKMVKIGRENPFFEAQ